MLKYHHREDLINTKESPLTRKGFNLATLIYSFSEHFKIKMSKIRVSVSHLVMSDSL